MKIKVYQIDMARDADGFLFMGLSQRKRLTGNADISLSAYEKVFEGDVDADDLEDVFCMFNAERRAGNFTGRSMSVSDVVEVVEAPKLVAACAGLSVPAVEPGFYFCDSVGFAKISPVFAPLPQTDSPAKKECVK